MYLIKHGTMQHHGTVKVQLHAFLTSALDGGEWSPICGLNVELLNLNSSDTLSYDCCINIGVEVCLVRRI